MIFGILCFISIAVMFWSGTNSIANNIQENKKEYEFDFIFKFSCVTAVITLIAYIFY